MITLEKYQRKSPKTSMLKWYLRCTPFIPVERSEFLESIQERTTLTTADVKAALNALQEKIIYQLKQGYSVRLGDLGSFHLTSISTGHTTAAECEVGDVKALRLQFRPSPKFRSYFDPIAVGSRVVEE